MIGQDITCVHVVFCILGRQPSVCIRADHLQFLKHERRNTRWGGTAGCVDPPMLKSVI